MDEWSLRVFGGHLFSLLRRVSRVLRIHAGVSKCCPSVINESPVRLSQILNAIAFRPSTKTINPAQIQTVN